MQREAARRGRILIVEDDVAISAMLVDLLEAAGYETLLARNGAQALTKLHTQPKLPDLILLDLMMPDIDGQTFVAAQKLHTRWCNVPIVVISALPRAAVTAMDLDAPAFVAKPFDIAQLLRIVAHHCCRSAPTQLQPLA